MDRQAAAFEAIFHRHIQWVVYQARLIVGGRDADDVAQEVFLSLYQAMVRGDFNTSASPLGWLRTATYRTARDRRRRLMREQPLDQDHDLNPIDETLMADAERALAIREQWACMLELVGTLSPERRMVFVMAEIDQMTLAEIAEVLELSPNTVSTRLRLARADFAAALARKLAEERRKLRGMETLLLPLDADALLRMVRALPRPDVSASDCARIWEGIRREIDRQEGLRGLARCLRLKSEASKFSTLVLGRRSESSPRQPWVTLTEHRIARKLRRAKLSRSFLRWLPPLRPSTMRPRRRLKARAASLLQRARPPPSWRSWPWSKRRARRFNPPTQTPGRPCACWISMPSATREVTVSPR